MERKWLQRSLDNWYAKKDTRFLILGGPTAIGKMYEIRKLCQRKRKCLIIYDHYFEPKVLKSIGNDCIIVVKGDIYRNLKFWEDILNSNYQFKMIILKDYYFNMYCPEILINNSQISYQYIDIMSFEELNDLIKFKYSEEELHDLYLKLGGYPAVWAEYLRTNSMYKARKKLRYIVKLITNEIIEFAKFNPFNASSFKELIKNDTHSKQELTTFFYPDRVLRTPKAIDKRMKDIKRYDYNRKASATCFLVECGIIKPIPIVEYADGSFKRKEQMVIKFTDTGILSIFLERAYLDKDTIDEYLNDCFIFNRLCKKHDLIKLTSINVNKSNVELEYIFFNMQTKKWYGVPKFSAKGEKLSSIK